MILEWGKPPKLRSKAEHDQMYQSDSGVDGTYVPNMDKAWQEKFKAKVIKTGDRRIEIRKTQHGVQMLLVVRYASPGLHVVMSANGKLEFEGGELALLNEAVMEAYRLLVELAADDNWAVGGNERPRDKYPWEVDSGPVQVSESEG